MTMNMVNFLKCYDKIFLPSGLLKSFLGGERFMKKIKFILCILVLMIGTMGFCISAYADEFSDNTQELVFTPSKVWKVVTIYVLQVPFIIQKVIDLL